MKKLSSNMEDYLEAILELKETNKIVRVKDIASRLGLNRSTVTLSLKTLCRAGLVVHEKYGYVDLLPQGEEIASEIQKRHKLLAIFLHDILALDYNQASIDACVMEHSMSAEAIKHLTLFVEFIQTCPCADGEPDWLKNYKKYVRTGKRPVKKKAEKERLKK